MDDDAKTREQLLEELRALRARVSPPERGEGNNPQPQPPAWVTRIPETMADSLFVLDTRWRFVFLNGQALRDTGQSAHELLGRSLWEKFPALLGTPLEGHYRRAVSEQTPVHFEMCGLISGRWLEIHAFPSPDGLVAYSRDATLRKQAETQLQEYARGLLEVQETERRRVACELHDEIGQALTGLRLTLDLTRRLPPEQLQPCLGRAVDLVQELTGKVRDLSLRLRPSMLDDMGLLPTLLWHVERFGAQTRVQASLEHRGLEGRLPSEVETAAYRIVQEALSNVARHAAVGKCAVRVWLEEGVLHLRVEDDGRGFDARRGPGRAPSTGLSGMRERATLLGGYLTVESSPGQGTRVAAELPVRGKGDGGDAAVPGEIAG
jgi:PAS domain S-box-containing protein